ncbi:MAG: LysR family transcriptional regulator [Mailhella sp.]|nr:LysR family transcriptional regulator [Mailhella sp.]
METGSLSAAAERLHYTASGISRMMAALESEVGFPLLVRRHEGVLPTPECESLLPAIRGFIAAGEACRQHAARIRGLEIGSVTVGTAYSEYYGLLSDVIAEFRREHPGIVVQLVGGYSSQLAGMMEQRRLDLCIISRREGDFAWKTLFSDELVAWIPAEHRLAAEEEVPLSSFQTEPYIDIFPGQESDNARFFKENRLRPNTQFTTADSHSACAMVEAGLGIALNNALNSKGRGPRLKVLPLSPRYSVEIGLAVRRDASPAVQKFAERTTAMLEECGPAYA